MTRGFWLLLGAGVALAVALTLFIVGRVDAAEEPPGGYVATLTTGAEWEAGVRDHPLATGEQLLFDFGNPHTPTWTMAGVDYALDLAPVDEHGRLLKWPVRMAACASTDVEQCPQIIIPATSRWWVESRP